MVKISRQPLCSTCGDTTLSSTQKILVYSFFGLLLISAGFLYVFSVTNTLSYLYTILVMFSVMTFGIIVFLLTKKSKE